jgi:dynein assembly factor 1
MSLQSLSLKGNYLTTASDIRHVLELPNLAVLDIQGNRIDDAEVVDVLAEMPSLKVLYLQGNDVVKKIKQYRKTLIYRCRQLKYLDDRPVFEDERRRVDAWGHALDESGGDLKVAQEAERQELDAIRREKKERDDRNFLLFEQMMIEGRRKRQEEEEERKKKADKPELGGGDSNNDEDEVNPFSGERIVPVQDCAFLQQEREKRWAAVVNTPDVLTRPTSEATSTGNNQEATESNDQEAGQDTAIIPVDSRRLEVLHQCATVGAGTFSSRDPFVDASFQVIAPEPPLVNSGGDLGVLLPPPAPMAHAEGIKEKVRDEVQALKAGRASEAAALVAPLVPPPAPTSVTVAGMSSITEVPSPPQRAASSSTSAEHTNVDELD